MRPADRGPKRLAEWIAAGIRAQGVVCEALDLRETERGGVASFDVLGALARGYKKHVNLGHNHPEVIEAVHRVEGMLNRIQASIGPLVCALGQALATIAPGVLDKSFFCGGGAEAVEGARRVLGAFEEGCEHRHGLLGALGGLGGTILTHANR